MPTPKLDPRTLATAPRGDGNPALAAELSDRVATLEGEVKELRARLALLEQKLP